MKKIFILCAAALLCLPAWAGAEVVVNNVAELQNAVSAAAAGGDPEIVLAPGTYSLDSGFWVERAGLTVRGQTTHPEDVILEGQGMFGGVTHIFWVAADNVTLADMTLRNVANHLVQVHGDLDADHFTIRNCILQDAYEQFIKISYNPEGDISAQGSDQGVVENCRFEYTEGVAPNYYTGGIDGHLSRDWIVRNNTFQGIRSPDGENVAEYAVHFWSDSANNLVERNRIINCDRGIGFGLGDRGHHGGIIRNNMIYHDGSPGMNDVGIALESADNVQVYNNTVLLLHDYWNAIEARFPAASGCLIVNNLVNHDITLRDGSSGELSHNVTNAQADWFASPATGDPVLAWNVGQVVDQGRAVEGLSEDFYGNPRPLGGGIDIGAFEYPAN